MALAAALSVQSPFTNDAFRNSDCVAARKNLDSDHGDPITLLNAYREWLQVWALSGFMLSYKVTMATHILFFYAHTEMFGTVYSMDHGYLYCISISIVQVVVWGGVTVGYLELQQNYDISET